MTKNVFSFLVMLLFVLGCSSGTENSGTEQESQSTQADVNEYPDLVLTFEDGRTIQTKELDGNNVFILFQPDCQHCHVEAIQIEQRLQEFKDYTLYFISSSAMEAIKAFAESLELDNKNNVRFAWTSTESVLNHYGPIQTPSVYIYSSGKLIKSFNGQTEIENILEAL